ncbi:MAG: hypothetical protein K2L54_05075, partial [Clostridiales bacterium]|nr:hypothetical protein [Clostridiales bacterium]
VSGTNTDTPTKLLQTDPFKGMEFISIAAGKQKSSNDKPLYSTNSLDITSGTVNGFNSAVQNDAAYLTGAINTDNELYVWSNNDSGSDPVQIKFGGVENSTKASKFIAVYSGYGNHLFAVTAFGKLVHIYYDSNTNTYKQEVYDEFRGVDGVAIKNWAVNSDNTVRFNTVPATSDDPTPSIGDATFYVWQADRTSAASEGDNTVWINSNNGEGAYDALVSLNNSGDVYRILTASDDAGIKFLNVTKTSRPSTFAPKFYYDGKEMTEDQRENMFGVEIVN